jgi:hypothetical protein
VSKPDLSVRWSKRENALVYDGEKPSGGMLAYHFEGVPTLHAASLIKDLDDRGYDLTALRFSIRRKKIP